MQAGAFSLAELSSLLSLAESCVEWRLVGMCLRVCMFAVVGMWFWQMPSSALTQEGLMETVGYPAFLGQEKQNKTEGMLPTVRDMFLSTTAGILKLGSSADGPGELPRKQMPSPTPMGLFSMSVVGSGICIVS